MPIGYSFTVPETTMVPVVGGTVSITPTAEVPEPVNADTAVAERVSQKIDQFRMLIAIDSKS
jgi:hypothetical protein